MNREQYLEAAVDQLSSYFEEKGYTLPPVKVSCSWPGGGSARKRIGECWPRSASESGINEIFISPSIEDSVRCLDILVHELIHAVDDCQHGHRKEFTAIMRAVGLEGKPTATHAGEALTKELQAIVELIGEYPHKKLEPNAGRKKQTTRMIKVECLDCDAVFRMSSKWVESAKICPCCGSNENNLTVDGLLIN